jgi:lantibiotic modifying enzyme
MLYKPEFFEPLTETPWDAARVRGQIDEIVRATDLSPCDDRSTLYGGASGVIWALDRLGVTDLAGDATRALAAWRAEPDYPERLDEPPFRSHASLFFGETGPLYVAWLLTQDGQLADDLYARIRQNEESPTNELMSGSVGTMRVAKAMLDRTGEERWADAWRASARVLLERRDEDGLWTTPPWGPGLGGAHGASTTANILLQGGEDVTEETAAALAKYAVVEDGLANWPMVAGDELLGYDGQIRVQWCHGAAGVVSSSAGYLGEELLLGGAELCWQAGPPSLEKKGPGLCHGTAGTGYSFLKVFERTGDEKWLDRARRFAVHALEQVGHAEPRHSLFTGGIGAALFAADCLEIRPQFPIVDAL